MEHVVLYPQRETPPKKGTCRMLSNLQKHRPLLLEDHVFYKQHKGMQLTLALHVRRTPNFFGFLTSLP